MTAVLIAVLVISLLSLMLVAQAVRALTAALERRGAGADAAAAPPRSVPIFSSHRTGSPDGRGRRPRVGGVRGGSCHGGAAREVHISRRANWWEHDGGQITAREFEALVAADADLSMIAPSDVRRGEPRWIAELATGAGPEPRENLIWRAGRIVARHPSPALLGKMCELAAKLGARVQGDDGEFYDA